VVSLGSHLTLSRFGVLLTLTYILSFSVDPARRGMTLRQVADYMMRLGQVQYAIEMDGGSSSTLMVQRRLVSQPHCLDVYYPVCERPVSTVFCLG
jgi:hypothetical protein